MKALLKICLPALAAVALVSCGGGGGSNGGALSPPASGSITINPQTTTLPPNPTGVPPFLGSPYLTEVDITWRTSDGSLVTGTQVNVAINPASVAAFSTLDDPTTTDVNEFTVLLGNGPVDVVAGHATIFVHSLVETGNAVLTVSGVDPNTSQTVQATKTFTVSPVSTPLPASVNLSASPTSVYLQGAGGGSSSVLTALVTDGGGQPVEDPVNGNAAFNNVKFEIVGDSGAGTLSGNSANGGSTSGQSINVRTTNGIANASYRAGIEQGPVTIKVTADGADNNVDNGITDPVTATTTITVSDGKLFSLVITTPVKAITANSISGQVSADPDDPDGSYSLVISVLATDRQGNPVVPGTPINFGAVDAPLTGYPASGAGDFAISGNDGNPAEGGTLFTAPSGQFTTAGGGAGPGDTLLVFGKDVPGNSDLESARFIDHVNSATSLNVTSPFNPNDTTGSIVDNGPVLPYIIGRAAEANITSTATTNEDGVATVHLTYPVSRLGKSVAVWAQGDGGTDGNTVRKVTDVAIARFAGIAPATLTASPDPIRGNITSTETVCVSDALGSPIAGIGISFVFHDLEIGQGFIDGQSGAGVFDEPTNASGCTVGQIRTLGVPANGSAGVTFTAGGGSIDVAVVSGGDLILQASPSSFIGDGSHSLTLTLIDSSGNGVPGVAIGGSCGAGASISSNPSTTDANGQSQVTLNASGLDDYGSTSSATCTFQTAAGSPSVTVNLQGRDLCDSDPMHAGCAEEGNAQVTLKLMSNNSNNITAIVTSSPNGLSCPVSDQMSNTCSFSVANGTVYTLTEMPGPNTTFVSWSGGCVSSGANTATFVANDGATCTANFSGSGGP